MKCTARVQKWSLPKSIGTINGLFGLAAMLAIVPVLIGFIASLSDGPADKFDVIDFSAKRIVSVQEARALIASGALVIDARDAALRQAQPLANAQPLAWRDLASSEGDQLSEDDAALTGKLQALGLSATDPVVVIGDPLSDNTDEGRLVLALRSLGHPRTVLVDGGVPALRAAGLPTIYPPFGAGDFRVKRQHAWQLSSEALRQEIHRGDVAVIETAPVSDQVNEKPGEGQTDVRHISLSAFRDAAGQAMAESAIAHLLAESGITSDMRLVTIGTDADGAGWTAALLLDLGYDVAGYGVTSDGTIVAN